MSLEATKRPRQDPPQGRKGDRDRTRKEAIAAIRKRGDESVSVTVTWAGPGSHRVAFAMSGAEAAAMVQAAIRKQGAKQTERLRPNAALAEALTEGRSLEGRFASAQELFDALEAEGQK